MKKCLYVAFLLIVSKGLVAQDINFSQFYELPLLRNPSLAGIFEGDIRITSAFRSQWGSVTTPYKTMALGAEVKFNVGQGDNFLTLGTQITSDQAGDSKLNRSQLLPSLTFHKALGYDQNTYLSLGVMGGPVQQRFDASALTFSDQFVNGAYSATNPTHQQLPNSNVTYADGAVGLTFSSAFGYNIKYYVGAALFHFTEPKVAFDQSHDVRLNRKMAVNVGLSIPTSDYDKMIVYGDFFTQGGNRQMQGGFLFKHDLEQTGDDQGKAIYFGSFYRWDDAIIPVVKLDFYPMSVGLTYDVNISKLKSASQVRGGFELSLSYKSFLNIRNSSAEKVRCPSF